MIAAWGLAASLACAAAPARATRTSADALAASARDFSEFERQADGSRRRADASEPVFAPSESPARPAAALAPRRPYFAPLATQPPVAVFVPRDGSSRPSSPLPPMTAAALAGLCFLALYAIAPAPTEPSVSREPSGLVMAPTRRPPSVAVLPAKSPDPEPFVPASFAITPPPPAPTPAVVSGTWRAISQREQSEIERWNASTEKAQGRASLEQWLDSRASLTADEASLLKKKLGFC